MTSFSFQLMMLPFLQLVTHAFLHFTPIPFSSAPEKTKNHDAQTEGSLSYKETLVT